MKELILNLILRISGQSYQKEYSTISKLSSKAAIDDFQTNKIHQLVIHANDNSPYYRQLFKKCGIVRNGELDIKKFAKIPLLTKDKINQNRSKLISRDLSSRKWHVKRTGGSTGEPVELIHDSDYTKWRNATLQYYYKKCFGVNEEVARKVLLWGSESDFMKQGPGLRPKIMKFLRSTLLLNSFAPSSTDLERYAERINSFKPLFIRGYSGALFDFAKYILAQKIRIYSPNFIIGAAENLHPYMRKVISQAFQAPVFNYYGTREVGCIAGECRYGSIHLFPFNNLVEILDENGTPSKEGRLVITSLHNYSLPIIRYEIGDYAAWGNGRCQCGLNTVTLKKLTGRVTEQFITKEGGHISTLFFIHFLGVALNKGYIKQFQVIQEDYDKVKVIFIPNRKLPQKERDIIDSKIKLAMGKNCLISWEEVQNISKTSSGKYIYAKSLVGKNHQ